jgi:hypothetical protein
MQSDLFENLSITNFATWMDGGTLTFNCISKNGNNFEVTLSQFVNLDIPEKTNESLILPGRIYINDNLVEIRSTLEKDLIVALKANMLNKGGLLKMEKKCLVNHITYLESEDYVKNALKHNKQ